VEKDLEGRITLCNLAAVRILGFKDSGDLIGRCVAELAPPLDRLPPQLQLSFGIGIHVGDAVLGLIGTEERIEYTAIGDDVNTAKRLQQHSGIDQILDIRTRLADGHGELRGLSHRLDRMAEQLQVREPQLCEMNGNSLPRCSTVDYFYIR
jgi:class 3 adenylate cyclase